MKNRIWIILVILATFIVLSCSEDNETIKDSVMHVSVKFPKGFETKNPGIEAAVFKLENVNTGEKIVREVDRFPVSFFNIEDGLYNISVEGQMKYEAKDSEGKIVKKSVDVRAFEENVFVQGGNFDFPTQFFLYNPSSSFVISEIFFAWSKTPEGKFYTVDQFIELYNNTDTVLYADGLCIAETKIKTSHVQENFSPDIRSEAVPIRVAYRIPGSGKEHPVQPGATFVVCDIAINHKGENNPNSVDLSKADFEWYDDYKNKDVDVPEVPNMERFVKEYNRGMWKLFNKGEHSYILFKVPNSTTAQQFSEAQAFTYEATLNGETYTKNIWKVENNKIIDAVECSTPSGFKWKAMSPTLDLTWTHSGDGNDERFGHSVKRKISHKDDSRIVLQDTNDSATDFIPTAPNPSPGTVKDHKE